MNFKRKLIIYPDAQIFVIGNSFSRSPIQLNVDILLSIRKDGGNLVNNMHFVFLGLSHNLMSVRVCSIM